MAILFGLLTAAPWYSRLRIQISSFFPSCNRLWSSLSPNVSAISALPAFKHAIVNLF